MRASHVVTGVVALSAATLFSQGKPPAQFRGGVELVQVEVRALDAKGAPIPGLSATDFLLRDGGVAQEIAHFRPVSVVDADAPPRTFLFVLGRGRLNEPTKAVQALIDFVRLRSLPTDRIGVVAYLRVLEPTTDHESAARFLEAFRDKHEAIDGGLNSDGNRYRGVAMWPVPPDITRSTRAAIEAIMPRGVDDLPGGRGNAVSRHNDTNYLRTALQYSGSLTGSKHTVFVSAEPFGIGTTSTIRNYYFRLATLARSSLSYIHAGGQAPLPMSRGTFSTNPGFDRTSQDRKDYELVAAQTGGLAAFYKFADQPLAALERMTRAHYLIGYYPTRQVAPDEFREITVSVRKAEVRLVYRQGYVAVPAVRPDDYRAVVAVNRLREAARRVLFPDRLDLNMFPPIWNVRLRSPEWSPSASGGRLRVTVAFDAHPNWVTFVPTDAGFKTDLDLLLLADDPKRQVLAERRVTLNIHVTADEIRRARSELISTETFIDVPTRPAHLRAVLFDYETNRTTGTQVRIER